MPLWAATLHGAEEILTTETVGQQSLDLQRVAEGNREAPHSSSSISLATEAAEVLLAQPVLGDPDESKAPPSQKATGTPEPLQPLAVETAAGVPIEAASGPAGAVSSGGASRYDSNLGELIAGLEATDDSDGGSGSDVPGSRLTPSGLIDERTPSLPAAVQASTPVGSPATPGGGNTGGGDDIGSGDDSGKGGDDTGNSGEDTGGGGDDLLSLFTVHPDVVDFNDVTAGSYREGTRYDALNQNDYVILPSDADEAVEAGFLPGTLFLTNNGNDTVTGGTLADLVDGGNGEDLLIGGGGDDSLFGGNGRDTLTGGAGDDVLSGGHGRDVFVYALTADEGDDLILDFGTGKGGDSLQIADLTDVNGDGTIDIGDLDAGGHSVSGTVDAIVITFDSGTSITLAGIDGSGVKAFADLVDDAKVNLDIL